MTRRPEWYDVYMVHCAWTAATRSHCSRSPLLPTTSASWGWSPRGAGMCFRWCTRSARCSVLSPMACTWPCMGSRKEIRAWMRMRCGSGFRSTPRQSHALRSLCLYLSSYCLSSLTRALSHDMELVSSTSVSFLYVHYFLYPAYACRVFQAGSTTRSQAVLRV